MAAIQFTSAADCRASISTQNHGDWIGTNVTYEQVTESSLTDMVPLYNAPILPIGGNSDTLLFNPAMFDAFSSGGGFDDTNGTLSFTIQANPNRFISSLKLSEGGTSQVSGTGSDSSFAQVTAKGLLKILAVDGSAISPVTLPIDFVFTNGLVTLAAGGSQQLWNGAQEFDNSDLNDALSANSIPFSFGATRISIEVENALHAQSESNTVVMLSKQNFSGLGVSIETSSTDLHANPEPTSMLTFLLISLSPWFTRRFGGR